MLSRASHITEFCIFYAERACSRVTACKDWRGLPWLLMARHLSAFDGFAFHKLLSACSICSVSFHTRDSEVTTRTGNIVVYEKHTTWTHEWLPACLLKSFTSHRTLTRTSFPSKTRIPKLLQGPTEMTNQYCHIPAGTLLHSSKRHINMFVTGP